MAPGGALVGEQLVQAAVEPAGPDAADQLNGRLGEAAPQRYLRIAAQVGRIARQGQRPGGQQGAQERPRRRRELLAHRQGVHRDADETARPGPQGRIGVGADRARQNEPPRPAFGVHSPLDGAEHLRARLPLVEQHGLGPIPQRGVGVGLEREGFALVVECHNARGVVPSVRDHRSISATNSPLGTLGA